MQWRLSYLKKGLLILLRPGSWSLTRLKRKNFDPDPIIEFGKWYRKAARSFWITWPEAMCLATADQSGQPTSRLVLLKEFDQRGFVFYTNLKSRKGETLEANPRAAATFYWESLQRQVRIEGFVERVSSEESDDYFSTRARLSQLGAWASIQSQPLTNRLLLERRLADVKRRFAGKQVPRPAHWGGLRLIPETVEFWKLRPNRLHDRFLYQKTSAGQWQISRLYP